MRKSNVNQSGFSVIEVLLIILVVAVLSAVGFVVYQRQKNGTKSTAATNSSTGVTAQSAQATTQYLTIKEWRVRLKLSSNTASLYYYIKPELPNVAYLSLKTISDIAPNCVRG